mmetsp:Transcript_14262/g.30458  ORF Transcript_14262/g.30458 Transcript_14262/m.30458 type:complete len:283 (-) Transcript_14262:337-1185(-)
MPSTFIEFKKASSDKMKQQIMVTPAIYEGCHEVDAAKHRLVMAHAWKKSATEMVLSAMRRLESAENEIKEAETLLDEACTRWGVIDVLHSSETESESSSSSEEGDGTCVEKLERIAMVSNKASNDDDESETDDVVSSSGYLGVVVAVKDEDANNNHEHAAKSAVGALVVEQIVVEESGVPQINGVYKRSEITNGCLPLSCDESVPIYSRNGSWEGEAVSFFIFRSVLTKRWRISCQTESELVGFYSNSRLDAELPPRNNDWSVGGSEGVSPAPRLKWFLRVH